MAVVLERPMPYDQSFLWRIQDAYFKKRGRSAWTAGDIPFLATSSYPLVRQHAELAGALAAELEARGLLAPSDELRVLEIGCGAGRSAVNFFRALENGCGARGRALVPRVRYLLSDFAEANVASAASSPELAPRVGAGQIVPVVFDLCQADGLDALEGDTGPALVLASYVCCVTPVKVLRKDGECYFEKTVELAVDESMAGGLTGDEIAAICLERAGTVSILDLIRVGAAWSPVDLEAAFADPIHGAIVRELCRGLATATVVYPTAFIDGLRRLARVVRRGGLVLITDFGSADRFDVAGPADARPQIYGNSLNHHVSFAGIEIACWALGWQFVGTKGRFRTVHSAAIAFAEPPSPALTRRFRRVYERDAPGEALLELRAAIRAHIAQRDWPAVARLARRCLRLDRLEPQALNWMGQACFELGRPALARRYFRRGAALDRDGVIDFELAIGRAYHRENQLGRAIVHYRRALSRRASAEGFTHLAGAYWDAGRFRRAYRAVRRALALAPEDEAAGRLMAALQAAWTAHLAGGH